MRRQSQPHVLGVLKFPHRSPPHIAFEIAIDTGKLAIAAAAFEMASPLINIGQRVVFVSPKTNPNDSRFPLLYPVDDVFSAVFVVRARVAKMAASSATDESLSKFILGAGHGSAMRRT